MGYQTVCWVGARGVDERCSISGQERDGSGHLTDSTTCVLASLPSVTPALALGLSLLGRLESIQRGLIRSSFFWTPK